MSTNDPLTRRHLTVRGRVQGVGFRWFAREAARTLGLTGWVRNREDGSVEAEAQGTEAALEAFIERLSSGNPAATVRAIDAAPATVRDETAFTII
ncbi:MAG: acylphosphatase [Elusimicrobia bacterium CG11_big_fil_rev_8_21_14_0_20_64_6]|nr:MAG: acylphosphatase [Elusimicrobia bacterium CG11_big_fil_rev_8_21_14_0_20_64_6]